MGMSRITNSSTRDLSWTIIMPLINLNMSFRGDINWSAVFADICPGKNTMITWLNLTNHAGNTVNSKVIVEL